MRLGYGVDMATRGDADISVVGALLSDPGRCRVLWALGDGRALPAGRLADEAGVSAATGSAHLGKLLDAGLLAVEAHGRHRYYRLAGPTVGRLLETMAQLAPAAPVRSLRQHTRAHALREARTCYDHLAGRLGVAVMGAMLQRKLLRGGDGRFDPDRPGADRLSAYGRDVDYELTGEGTAFLAELGVVLPPRRPVVRYCIDWSEQAHHLAGGLGAGLLSRLVELEWVCRNPGSRAVDVTDQGRAGLAELLAIDGW